MLPSVKYPPPQTGISDFCGGHRSEFFWTSFNQLWREIYESQLFHISTTKSLSCPNFHCYLEKKKKIKTHPAEILVACRTQVDLTEVRFLKLGTFEPGMLSQIACPDKESATHPITPELSFKEISLQPFPLQRLASQVNSTILVAQQNHF